MNALNIGLIGGTGEVGEGLLEAPAGGRQGTPFGDVEFLQGSRGGHRVFYVPRHGFGHVVPPHRVNYRAIIWGLRALGCDQVLATAAVGSLLRELAPGQMVAIDQFIDFTKCRISSFSDDSPGARHIDLTEPYCPRLRQALIEAGRTAGVPIVPSGCYICTEGPRYETPAEVRMFAMLGGTVVGMTNVPEVVLARELGLCYAALAVVTNYAAGISQTPLGHDEVAAMMRGCRETLERVLAGAIQLLSWREICSCGREGFWKPS